jgi:pimeloyl-ACP methyl ester carboxylesterase
MIALQRQQKHIALFALIAFVFAANGVFYHTPREIPPSGDVATTHGILSLLFSFPQFTLYQFKSDGVTPIPEGGTIAAAAVTLGASLSSAILTPLRLQVELRPLTSPFTGVSTAASGILLFTKTGTVAMSGLAGGSYHWRGRLVNALTGDASAWRGGGDFTVVLREPIVIVPGIAGTILQKADGTEAWPNIDQMLISPSDSYLDALALDATGNAPAAWASGIRAGAGGESVAQSTVRAAAILKTATLTLGGLTLFSDDFYGNLIKAFTSAGYVESVDLFTAPYDWRMDINNSVASLAATIARARATSPTGKINIIAHSMGGLLVKKYLAGSSSATATSAAAPNTSFLDKVVFVAVPELGAPYALKMLNYGDNLSIPIANQDEMKKIAQNMPAIYELLPSEKYLAIAGSYVQDFRAGADTVLDFAATAQLMTINASDPTDSRNPALIALGDAFHRSIDAAPVAAPNVYTIVGCGMPTITGYDLYDNGVVDLERGSGDGTVPEVSAMDLANTSHNYFVMSGVTGIDHTGLTSDARPVSLIANIVAGVSGSGSSGAAGSGAMPLPQGISSSLADCATQNVSQGNANGIGGASDETTIEFSVHGATTSTINLGVYDASGNYTGITASGTVAIGIPGSEYEKLGNNVFILVPAGRNYKEISHANASGTFEMKVRGYRGGAVDREATYLSVPLADASTSAELNFSGFNNTMDLRLGKNIRHPDSTLSAPFSRDHKRKEWQK